MTSPETPYVETEVLLALLNEDEEHAIELLTDMSESERGEFLATVGRLMQMLRTVSWCVGCGQYREPSAWDLGAMWPNRWHPTCQEQAAQHDPRWGK